MGQKRAAPQKQLSSPSSVMGQKRAAPQKQPEDEVSSEEEEEQQQTEPSVRPPPPPLPPPKSSSTVAQPASSSDDDDDDEEEEEEGEEEEGDSSEEDEEEEEEPKQTEPPKKPTGSQKQPAASEPGPSHSLEISDRDKNKRIKPSVAPVGSTMNSDRENSCPANDSRGTKRKLFKHKASDAPPEEKIPKGEKPSVEPKKMFQRVWSDEDEIALLKGVAEYWDKNGGDPFKDQDAFHGFIKDSLNVNFSKIQLIDKIRRLKKKYENNARKGKNGQDPKFSNEHEDESFELSKKIWATERAARKPKPNITSTLQLQTSQKAKPLFRSLNADEVAEINKFLGIPDWHVDGLEKALQLVEASKREELKEKLNDLKFTASLEIIVKRTELMSEEANLVSQAVKSSRDH